MHINENVRCLAVEKNCQKLYNECKLSAVSFSGEQNMRKEKIKMRKISKIFGSLVLVCALLFSAIPTAFAENADVWENDVSVWDGDYPEVNTSATYGGGDGTSGNPYLLKSAADLAQLAVNVNNGSDYSYYHKYFKLCCDIDMNNHPWIGIGSSDGARKPATAFKGVFDGDNHVIYNFNLESKPNELGRGFFGVCIQRS